MSRTYAVIGAGISGLAAAIRLRALEPDASIVVLERDFRPGGKIQTDRVDGFTIEAGPDAFLGTKPGGVALSGQLGIDSEFVGPLPENRQSFVMRKGALVPLPEGLSGLVPGKIAPMLRTPLLSPWGKARMLADFVIPPRRDDQDESLAGFVRRRAGSEVYERMVEPLLAGIYGGDGEQLSLAATFPQFRTSELTHGGWLKGAVATRRAATDNAAGGTRPRGFLGFDRGMSYLVESAVEHLRSRNVEVRTGSRVTAVRPVPGPSRFGIDVDGGRIDVDGVVITVPAWIAAPILKPVDAGVSAELAAIEHGSTAIVAIGFPESNLARPLKGYGYIVPRAESRQVMAMTWISSKWRHRAPAGQVLVRGFFGRYGIDEILANDDDALAGILLREMREVLGIDTTSTVVRCYRWDKGMPQYNLGHRERIARIETAMAQVPGIELAGNYLHGVGIPDSIVTAQRAAENLVAMATAVPREPGMANFPG